MSWPHSVRRIARACAGVFALAACARPGAGLPGQYAARLYVLNGADATVSVLNPSSGGPIRAPLPVSPPPLAMAAGPGGTLLLLARTAEDPAPTLTQLTPSGEMPAARRLALPPATPGILLAAAGSYAAVSFIPYSGGPGAERCRLAILDLSAPAETTLRTFSLCGDGELATALLMDAAEGRARIFVGLARYRAPAPGMDEASPPGAAGTAATMAGGRVVALDAASGRVVATLPLPRASAAMALGWAHSPLDGTAWRRLYVVQPVAGADDEAASAPQRLLTVSAATLAVEASQALFGETRYLTVAADGKYGYALSQDGRELREIDLSSGAERPLARFPAEALDVAADGRVYATNPFGGSVWAIDRRTRSISTFPVGRGPIALVFAP